MSTENVKDEIGLDELMEQRLRDNFGHGKNEAVDISDERLKEMNKKLPEWSLEPPYSFLK